MSRIAYLRTVIVMTGILVAGARFAVIDAASHSASDTLRPWLLEVAILAIVVMVLLMVVPWLAGGGGPSRAPGGSPRDRSTAPRDPSRS